LSEWVKQHNGVFTRRNEFEWEVLYPNGNIRSCTDILDLAYIVHADQSKLDQMMSGDPFRFTIPGKPPSSNTAYENLKSGGRRLSTKGRNYKKFVRSHVGSRRLPERKYQYKMLVYWKWDTITEKAKCEVEAADLESCPKLIIDALFDELMPGVYQPDKWVYNDSHTKIHEPDKARHRVVVTIWPWE